MITSSQNSKIKHIRGLKNKKNRDIHYEYLVEGIHHIGIALDSGNEILSIVYSPDLLKSEFGNTLVTQAEEKNISIFSTTESIFKSLTKKDNPAGILGVLSKQKLSVTSINGNDFPWLVAIDSPQDPGNVGTILRTIDAVGADGLIIIDNSVDLHHPSLIRASMGAFFNVPIIPININEFWAYSQKEKYYVIGTSAKNGNHFTKNRSINPRILLLGNEQKGLSTENIKLCDQVVSLPMRGNSTSLNLSVAAGVLLYAMQDSD